MRSASVTELFDRGFNFARHLPKAAVYEGHKKQRKDTTHVLTETTISILATPLKSWPKHKSKNAGYGKPRYNMEVPLSKDNKLEIPVGATHLEYSTSRIAIIDTINHVHDFTHYRGQLRFGKYTLSTDRFTYMDKGRELEEETCVENKMRKREEPVERVVREHPEPLPPKLPKPPKKAEAVQDPAPTAKVPRPPREKGGESVCGFIDSLIEEKSRTKQEILDLVLAKFPGRDPKATMSTIGVRPTHMRKAGRDPKPFIK